METSDNFSGARSLAIQSLKFDDDRDLVLKTRLAHVQLSQLAEVL
jgi:hypothetical protein